MSNFISFVGFFISIVFFIFVLTLRGMADFDTILPRSNRVASCHGVVCRDSFFVAVVDFGHCRHVFWLRQMASSSWFFIPLIG